MSNYFQKSWIQGINTIDHKRRKCSLKSAMGCTLFIVLGVLFAATNMVKWNTEIVYVLPEKADLQRAAGTVIPRSMLYSPDWSERKYHIVNALKQACSTHGFSVTTHKSLRVLGAYVPESILYVCSTQRALANVKLEARGSAYLLCRETYGKAVREVKRPNYKMSAFDLSKMDYIEEQLTAPDLICSIAHGVDVTNSNWRI
jgi:hypothetical protein